MKQFSKSILNLLLALGVILILVGCFCAFQFLTEIDEHLPFSSVLISVVGAVLIYISLTLKKNAFLFFSGLYLFLIGLISFFLTLNTFENIKLKQIWPGFMVVCAICLFLTCIYKYREIRSIYVVPAFVIFFLSGVFFLFSFGIIRFSFIRLISRWWPLLLIISGGILVFIFLYQQTPDNHFPYEKEDLFDFTDSIKNKGKSKE